DRTARLVAFDATQVIPSGNMVFADDANAARLFAMVAIEYIPFDQAPVAMAHGDRALAFHERVRAIHIAARLVGDALHFTVTSLKVTALPHAFRPLHRPFAVSDPDDLTAIL